MAEKKIGTKTNELQEKPRGSPPLANGGNFDPVFTLPNLPFLPKGHTRTPPFVCVVYDTAGLRRQKAIDFN